MGRGIAIVTCQAPTLAATTRREQRDKIQNPTVTCTQILSTVISALQTGLLAVDNGCHVSGNNAGSFASRGAQFVC